MTTNKNNIEIIAPQNNHDLAPGTVFTTASIAHSIVIKDGDVFFLSESDGRVPFDSRHGFGLYYHDCRYLSGYDLKLAGRRPEQLVWTADTGFRAVLGMTNPELETRNGTRIEKHNIEIKWLRIIDGAKRALYDDIVFRNLSFQSIDFQVSLTFLTSFEDVFAVRGWRQEQRGQLRPPVWDDGVLNFAYEGADKLHRALTICFSPEPTAVDGATIIFEMQLEPKQSSQLQVTSFIFESLSENGAPRAKDPPNLKRVEAALTRSANEWLKDDTTIFTDSFELNRVLDRSLSDLSMLRSYIDNEEYFAAGVPWFVALFGRDSIITALQTLAYDPEIADHTIRLLAKYQGRRKDDWKDEEPGKILHELRVGEMARLGEIPHRPYYGTIDATPLFLILVGHHAAWTGDQTIFNELRDNIEAALEWISIYGDIDRDGYVEYTGSEGTGLANQGWKDSFDAIVNRDGSLAAPPIALVEVQGYVYQAKIEMAELYRRVGEIERANSLQREAETLRQQFNEDFWVDDGFYALALQEDNRPAAVLSSNAGHALWTGIADKAKAEQTCERLMASDMFNGWGVRTLSQNEKSYNPLGYHLGTIWPHDNSMIVAGFKTYGFDHAALRVFAGLLEASVHFDGNRMPELFAGFPKEDYGVPVIYPVACQPQAWSAGAVPYMLSTLLGLVPEAFEERLRIVRPTLPNLVNQVEVRGLRVGDARVDLKFERTSEGIVVTTQKLYGRLAVVVENER
jgi:glycogen debranching enzyme